MCVCVCVCLYVYMYGQGSCLRAGRPGFDPGCWRSGKFSSLLRVQTSAGSIEPPMKCLPGAFRGVNNKIMFKNASFMC